MGRVRSREIGFLVCMVIAGWPWGSAAAQEDPGIASGEILERYMDSRRLKTPEATLELERAVSHYRRSGEASELARGLMLLGMAFDAGDRHSEAMASYEEARRVLEAAGDRFGVVIVEFHMGDSETARERHALARDHLQSAAAKISKLKVFDQDLSTEMMAFFLQLLGLPPEVFNGGKEGFGAFVNQMRPLFLDMLELNCLLRLGESHMALAECPAASTALEKVRKHVEDMRVSQVGWLVAQILGSQANSAWKELQKTCGAEAPAPSSRMGQEDELRELDEAVGQALEARDYEGAVRLLTMRASLLQSRGEMNGAQRSLEQALSTARKLPDAFAQARAEDALGIHLLLWNRYEEALNHLEAALELYRSTGSEIDAATVLTYLGSINVVLGFHRTAEEQLQEALRLARKHRLLRVESEVLYSLARAYEAMGEPEEAERRLREAFEASPRDPFSRLPLRNALAGLYAQAGRDVEAEEEAAALLREAENLGIAYHEASARIILAQVAWRRHEWERADQQVDAAQRIYRANGWRYLESAASALKGVLQYKAGRVAEGIASYREAVDLYETIQGDLRVPDLLSGLNDQSGYLVYEQFIEILAAEGREKEAFEYSERARTRALLNAVGQTRISRPASSLRPEGDLLKRAEELRHKLQGLEVANRIAGFGMQEPRASAEEIRREYSDVLLQLRRSDPEYADLVQAGTVGLAELRKQVLPGDTTLVEFFVTEKHTFAWIVDREQLKMVKLDWGRKRLRDEVDYLLHSFEPPRTVTRLDPVKARQESSDLFRALIAPLRADIRTQRLILIPHDVLHQLPFAALWDDETKSYLVDQYTLSYAPSASVLARLGSKRTPYQGRALVLGRSLPAAQKEAQAVARLLRVKPILGDAATGALIQERAGSFDVLHLAMHGVYDVSDPALSRVELADGALNVHELMSNVDLHGVDLVVLSACESGIGKRFNGDEVVGVARAFFYAGSPAVVATLWRVEDTATELLMEKFYKRLRRGDSPAEALRSAQRWVSRQRGWQHPFYWAAFTLSGDPKAFLRK